MFWQDSVGWQCTLFIVHALIEMKNRVMANQKKGYRHNFLSGCLKASWQHWQLLKTSIDAMSPNISMWEQACESWSSIGHESHKRIVNKKTLKCFHWFQRLGFGLVRSKVDVFFFSPSKLKRLKQKYLKGSCIPCAKLWITRSLSGCAQTCINVAGCQIKGLYMPAARPRCSRVQFSFSAVSSHD